jgi:predicted DCC family thiol-disulfide oxidoreductase YuxK
MSGRWAPQAAADVPDGLILFDGVCLLCSGWVRRVIERDKAARFRFTPVQSPFGTAIAQRFGISVENPETNAAVIGGRICFKSDAAIAVWSRLPRWGWVRIFQVVPRPIRNWAYDVIARNRYRWFGRTDNCMVPRPELRARFIFDEPAAVR